MIQNINYFPAAAPQAYGKTTAGVPASPMSFQENLQITHAAYDKRNAQQGVGKRSAEELEGLSDRYDPDHMTREQYDAFLDELEEKGVLSRDDKMLVKYPEMRFGEHLEPHGVAPGEGYIVEGDPLLPLRSSDYDGNASLFVKAMLERELVLAERSAPLEEDCQRIKALRTVSDILEGMRT